MNPFSMLTHRVIQIPWYCTMTSLVSEEYGTAEEASVAGREAVVSLWSYFRRLQITKIGTFNCIRAEKGTISSLLHFRPRGSIRSQ